MKFKRAVVALIVLICFCITLFAAFKAGMKYCINKRLNQDRECYIGSFYSELCLTIELLSSVEDWELSIQSTTIRKNPFRQLLTKLNSMKKLNEYAYWNMRNDKNAYVFTDLKESFGLIQTTIGDGWTCDDFLKDGVLSQNEIRFLISLKQDLERIKNSLYNEETGQANSNITMEELRDIVKPFTDKYDRGFILIQNN
ncbi:MAG TPA: hypothetical protein PLH43_13055 [Acetivibrio sp.]|uniref:hypothetical protein n=1 Tax=Acetivibrio sp. TaxID=1872092 RepID=UPI002D0F3122|nr:hypothetical protein [Acetivibrio sp.]HOM03731.1 hypothetical protein [Acetivibrio sp.]